MVDGADLTQHINTFNLVSSDMIRINIKLDDEDKVMTLLTSLPASYKHLVCNLMLGKETLEFKEVLGASMDHYHWKQNLGESFGEGLMVKGNRDQGRKKDKDNIYARGHSRSKSKSKTVKYYKFQKKGHMLRVCL